MKKSIYDIFRHQNLESKPEQEKYEYKIEKVNIILNELAEKKNRFLFYCPDVPFPVGTVKTIYDHVIILNKLGYNASVIHEVKGYRPKWLNDNQEYKKVEVTYLSKTSKNGKQSKPEINFKPTDTLIVPDGFWGVMESVVEIKTIQKVVFIMGYGGMSTAEVGLTWSHLGFNQAISVSDRLISDYQSVFPGVKYYKATYPINTKTFYPSLPTEKKPIIALSVRDREEAKRIINIFYSKYHFLDMFEFIVVKKKNVIDYADILRESAVLLLSDSKSGHSQLPLEAIASNTPVIATYGRGYEHLRNHKDIIFVDSNDEFELVEILASFCTTWLQQSPATYNTDKLILKEYSEAKVTNEVSSVYFELQENLIKKFIALKNTVKKQYENIEENGK